MEYLWIKVLHIISSTILFGTGVGTACVFIYAHRTREPYLIMNVGNYVVKADWLFTGISGIVQPITGFWLVYLAGYPLKMLWVWGAIVGYLIAAFCWFPVVYLQIKMRDFAKIAYIEKSSLPTQYFEYYRYWFCLGIPAFISLVVVFYLMTAKPI